MKLDRSRVLNAASACLVASGLIIGGAGGALALADPGDSAAASKTGNRATHRVMSKIAKIRMTKDPQDPATKIPKIRSTRDRRRSGDQARRPVDQRSPKIRRPSPKIRRPSPKIRRPSPKNRRPSPKNRRPKHPAPICPAAPSHPANLRHRVAMGMVAPSRCRTVARTRHRTMQLPPPRVDSGAWDTRPTGRHRRGAGRGGGRRGASARGRDGVCRRASARGRSQRYRSHPSPCRWSWPRRSGSGEP